MHRGPYSRREYAQDSEACKEQPDHVIPARCGIHARQKDAGSKRENADPGQRSRSSCYAIHVSILPAGDLCAEVAHESNQTAANSTCGSAHREIVK